MGNPRRFLGTGESEYVQEEDFVLPPLCAVEVTFRTHQQKLQLRPDPKANEILLGCFGRAYDRHRELTLHVLNAVSNHGTFVASPTSASLLSIFMQDFLSDAAKKLNLERGRDGTFWERRYRAIPIVDNVALEERFAYALTQGTKENLVWSARDWPGVTSIPTLLGGPEMVGRWRDGTVEGQRRRNRQRKIDRAKARGRDIEVPKVQPLYRDYPIVHHPLPNWAHLPVGKRRARVAQILADDDRATRRRHERDGTRPLGVRGILRADPFSRPANSKKSPAPICHASTDAGRKAFRIMYRRFTDSSIEATERVLESLPHHDVPFDATVPPLPRRHPRAARFKRVRESLPKHRGSQDSPPTTQSRPPSQAPPDQPPPITEVGASGPEPEPEPRAVGPPTRP